MAANPANIILRWPTRIIVRDDGLVFKALTYARAVSDVIRIELSRSILEAEAIAQAATEAGFHVQLLRNEHPETGAAFALGTCALLVRGDEEAEVRQLLAGLRY